MKRGQGFFIIVGNKTKKLVLTISKSIVAFIQSFFLKYTFVFWLLLTGLLCLLTEFFFNRFIVPPNHTVTTLLDFGFYLFVLFGLFILCMQTNKVILGNIFLLVFLLLGLEVTCYFLLGMPVKEEKKFTVPDFSPSSIGYHLGYATMADTSLRQYKVVNNDTSFDIHITGDHYNKRITPGHDSLKKKFALFFGCSICYGYGVEDNQTMPYYFQQNSRDFNSYNFAFSGYGPNHMIARLEYQNLAEQVSEKDGIGLYVFFYGHIDRAIGRMNYYTSYGHLSPYYHLKNGKIVREKMFPDGRWFTSFLYEKMYQLNIIKYFKLDLPVKLTDRHYHLVVEMMKRAKELYEEQFGNKNFYVLIHPNWRDKDELEGIKKMKLHMEKEGIDYIDLSDYIIYSSDYSLPNDPHPKASTHELLAKELLRLLHVKNTDFN